MSIGGGIAIFGIWAGSAASIFAGAPPEIFIASAIGTVFVAFGG